MVLEANSDVLQSLACFYGSLIQERQFLIAAQCLENVTSFSVQVKSFIQDMKLHITRAKLLAQMIAGRKVMVRIVKSWLLVVTLMCSAKRSLSLQILQHL